MQLQTAKRMPVKLRLALQGPSGAGKTYSALLVAHGLCGNWRQVAVIDTEHASASLYSHLGPYQVLNLPEPYSPEHYQKALQFCESRGMAVIILDTISWEWQYLLDYHASQAGNSFTNWSKVTKRHNQFVKALLFSPAHIIVTVRTKQDYVLVEKNGKMVPEKIALKPVQREDWDYAFTLVFNLDASNLARVAKDHTSLFQGKPPQQLSVETGKQLLAWCQPEPAEPTPGAETDERVVRVQITSCTTLSSLMAVYHQYPEYQTLLQADYQKQKQFIEQSTLTLNQLTNLNVNQNGNHEKQ